MNPWRRSGRFQLALGAGVVAALLAVTACGGGGSGSGSGSSSGGNKALTIAVADEPVSLDPCDSQDAKNAVVLRGNVTESLTDIDPKTGKVIPLLATSWQQVNPTTWTFQLRQNVKFQDGSVFDATAAAFGINRTLDKKLNCQNLEQFPNPVTASAIDANTLQIVTSVPDPILPLRVSYADLPSPKTSPDKKTTEPVGTGPYKFTSRAVGQSVSLTRFDGYWGQKPEATAVRYVYRKEDSVRAGMVKTGEASIAVPVAVQNASNDDRTRQFTENRVFFLRTQTNKPPFNDVRVRQAVAYAINKSQIVGSLMQKSGTPADQIVTKSVNGFVPDYTAPKYDLAKAKSLLAEAKAAGVDTSIPIQLITRPDLFPGSTDVIQAIAQNLTDAGFSIKIVSLDTAAWLKLLYAPFPANQPVDIVAISHDNVSGDASFTFPKYLGSKGCCSSINDQKVDDLINQANQAQGDQRSTLFQQAARTAYETDAAMIPIAEQYNLLMLAKGIEYQPNGLTGVELHISDVHFTK